MKPSRRQFLQGAAAGAGVWLLPALAQDAAGQLQAAVDSAVGRRNIGVAVVRLVRDGDTVREVFRVEHNADDLRPTASCFKAWLPLYYYTMLPQDLWSDGPGSLPYKVAVNSNNVATGELLQEVGRQQNFGNDLEKFNDFLLYALKLENGISSWNWPGNPMIGIIDDRFSSGGERMVQAGGELHAVGNVTTANDTLNGYRELFRRTFATTDDFDPTPQRRLAALHTMRLLSLPSDTDYLSPVERVLGRGMYVGKDGILPADSVSTGRVVNDAGLIPMQKGMYAVSFFSVGESEYSVIEILRTIIAAMFAAEQVVRLS